MNNRQFVSPCTRNTPGRLHKGESSLCLKFPPQVPQIKKEPQKAPQKVTVATDSECQQCTQCGKKLTHPTAI